MQCAMPTVPAPHDATPLALPGAAAHSPSPAGARPIQLSPAWLLFAALTLAVPLGALLAERMDPARAPALPVLSALPDFQLVDQAGRPFSRKDLLGRAWVADFVFTRCTGACPRLTAAMNQLQDGLTPLEKNSQIGLVSISVDPEHDTPAALRAYAEAHGADATLWRFLTGDPAQIEQAVVQGFKSPIEPPQKVDDAPAQAFDILHGEKLVLLDPDARIRGYYDVTEAPELQRLLRDLRQLIRGS
jgi:protein SCO1/2